MTKYLMPVTLFVVALMAVFALPLLFKTDGAMAKAGFTGGCGNQCQHVSWCNNDWDNCNHCDWNNCNVRCDNPCDWNDCDNDCDNDCNNWDW